MAVQVVVNQYLAINAVVLSDHVKAAPLTMESDAVDKTAMGDFWRTFLAGLRKGTLAAQFNDDYAAGSVDATLWPIFNTGTGLTTFEVREDAGAVSATNPKFTGSVLINQHSVGGSVGELGMKALTFPTSGTITRATA